MKIPVCDKCDGIVFDTRFAGELPEPERVKASEYFDQTGGVVGVSALFVRQPYVSTCKKCGEEYRYYV